MDASIVHILQEVNSTETTHKNKAKLIRFGMILLKKIGFRDDCTAKIFKATRQCVARWINRFLQFGIVGLEDLPRSGRPRLLNSIEEEIIDEQILSSLPKECNDEQPTGNSIKKNINDKLNVNISLISVYRLLNKLKYSYL